MFTKCLVIHKKVDDLTGNVDAMDPLGKFIRLEGILCPFRVGEAEGDVIREPVVPQEQLYFHTPCRLIDKIGTPPAHDLIRPLGENDLISHFFYDLCKFIVIDKLRIAKCYRGLTKEGTDPLFVQGDLFPEFPPGEKESKGMTRGLAEEFNTSRLGETFEAIQDIHPIFFKLIENHTAHGKGDPELTLIFFYQIEHHRICREVTFFRHLIEDLAVFLTVFVGMVTTNVKEGIVPQAIWLMNLKVKTNTGHLSLPLYKNIELRIQEPKWK